MKKFNKVFLAIALVWPVAANAENVTLLQAYQQAVTYDSSLRAAKQDNTAQREEINKSLANFMPQVRLSLYEGRGVTDSESPGAFGSTSKRHSVYDSRNYSLSVRQSIFSLANFADYAQSKAEVARSDAMVQKEENSLMGRVVGSYLDVLLATENLRYNEAQKASVQSQLHQAEKKYKAGLGTITEVNEAKANLETVIAQGLEWANGLEFNKRVLENVSGIYMNTFFVLNPEKLSLAKPDPIKVDDWVDLALSKNPEIQAAAQDVEAMRQEVRKNFSGHMPTLDLVASRTKTESDNNYTIGSKYDTDSIGLQLNVPLYSGGYTSATVRQAEAKLNFAEEKLTDKRRTISNDIRKYFNEVNNGIARIEAKSLAVTSNEIAVIGTQKAYESGIRSNVEVLNAQEKLYSAKRELAQERYKLVYNRIMLRQSAGLITEADLAETSQILSLVN
jgi:protease secretion system outer membrane protein